MTKHSQTCLLFERGMLKLRHVSGWFHTIVSVRLDTSVGAIIGIGLAAAGCGVSGRDIRTL